jgi:succinoglycan biosynthesis transport protein ExoP
MSEELDSLDEQRVPDFLKDPIGTLRRRWRWMLAVMLAGSVASVALWSSLEPRYYADATVVMDRQNVSERVVEPTIEEDSIDRIDAMAAQVLAREKLAGLVEQYDLYPEARRTESMDEVVKRVQQDVTIEHAPSFGGRGNGAQVFLVGFEADRPDAAAGMANTLADRFVQVSIDVQHRKQELATDFLKRELDTAERDLREQDHLIAEFKQENRGKLPDEQQANLARLALLQQQRQSLALQIADGETRVATLSSADDNSPSARLETLRNALRQELSQKTERHPDVIRLRTEIESLERDLKKRGIGTSPAALIQASEKKLAVLREQLAGTERELKELNSRVEGMPAVQEQLTALEAKGTLLREHYSEILRKVQDSELSGSLLTAQQADRVSVLNRAEPPTQPTKERWKYLILGLVASLGLSVILGFALEAMDPVLVTAAQVEAAGGIPVIASVPRIS